MDKALRPLLAQALVVQRLCPSWMKDGRTEGRKDVKQQDQAGKVRYPVYQVTRLVASPGQDGKRRFLEFHNEDWRAKGVDRMQPAAALAATAPMQSRAKQHNARCTLVHWKDQITSCFL